MNKQLSAILLTAILLMLALFSIGYFGLQYTIESRLPKIDDLDNVKLNTPLRIYTEEETLIEKNQRKK